jgi:hypothetical protein
LDERVTGISLEENKALFEAPSTERLTETRIQLILFLVIDAFPQFSGALEGHNVSFIQQEVFSGCRISAPACGFLLYTEFAETRDQDIFTRFKAFFNDLQ